MTGPNPYLYILTMALCTYCVRVVPLILLRREIKNRFIHSFLHYVPYATLSVMIFPSILHETASFYSSWAALFVAGVLAWHGRSLAAVAVAACFTVFLVECFI